MDLVQLERFVAIAETGSFRKAALRLDLSQPTLTRSIRQLESGIGGSLFERHGRGSRLTETGRVLLPHAQRMLNEGQRARTAVALLQGSKDPELIVAVSPPYTANIAPQAIQGALRAIPNLRIRLFQADGANLLERMRGGEFDVIFINPRTDYDLRDFDFEKVYQERYALAARAEHPIFRKRQPLTLETVTTYGWATVSNAMTRTGAESPFGRAGLPEPVMRAQVSSEHLLRPLILATDLLGYVAHDLVAQDVRDGRIRSIDLPGISMTTPAGLLVRKETTYSRAMKVFCREVRRVCREMNGGRP